MKYKIQALNGFNMYFDQIISVFRTKYETEDNINLDQLAIKTGLNRRKARMLLNFLADIGLSQKRTLKKTSLGNILFKYDDYFQNEGTLWLLHYLQSYNEYLIIWNRIINHLYDVDEVNRIELFTLFKDLKENISEHTYKRHIGDEIRVVLDSYINQNFSKLNLLEFDEDKYFVHRNSDVPELILLCSIILYRNAFYQGATALNIKDLCDSNNSPGKIFIIDEHIFRKKLENLKNTGIIGIESRGDLDQIRISDDLKYEGVLEKYYQG
ncbi:DUF4007 family protein [Clostridium lacusfryxellense]|uniref:DUF4007 family protein n=1 Tax=Clostridium lacusfryxellense TaxID=205328 RepID=UPI001C0AA361|nr:DUF4007 family protein [Clostridium lacusfryxellense]MBU3114583.1 DUF4007 family protein [Clostridium lacusfryxellense]